MKKNAILGIVLLFCLPGLLLADPYDFATSDFDLSGFVDEEWLDYLDYSSRLFNGYFKTIEPTFNDYLEKSTDRFDEYFEKVSPYMDRLLNDPNFDWNDYRNATRTYLEKFLKESRRELTTLMPLKYV